MALEAVKRGDTALLGRCAPRALIVTTPNKEYNLNGMVRCKMPTECRARHKTGIDEEQRKRQRAEAAQAAGAAGGGTGAGE